jgi:iron complex outermembrane receptor protein
MHRSSRPSVSLFTPMPAPRSALISARFPTKWRSVTPTAIACAVAIIGPAARAQEMGTAWASTPANLPTLTITAPAERQNLASISGLGDIPAWQTPVQAVTLNSETLQNAQVNRLADLTKLDASTTDNYNAVGYWDALSIRGFTLSNVYNWRREGLPINTETRIALDNKSAVEIFKGTSGMQAGVSSPGGLVNLLVKRPEDHVRSATFSAQDSGDVLGAIDLSQRFGPQQSPQAFGLRINAAAERLSTHVDQTRGHRQLLAFAGDWAPNSSSKFEAEIEHSTYSQPSAPGFSLLGDRLPSAKDIDPGINLNRQAWTQPVVFRGDTATLRWTQALSADWQGSVTYGEQRLSADDRAAFPYGCSTTGNYTSFCGDGSFDLDDYRSNNERRSNRSLLAKADGQFTSLGIRHDLSVSMLRNLQATRVSNYAFNYAGTGDISGGFADVPPASDPSYAALTRQEQSTELSARDAVQFNEATRAWLGVRHTRLHRSLQPTDGSTGVHLNDDVNTPWLAVGHTIAPQTQAYISWGEGIELVSVPYFNYPAYTNAGAPLPTLKSRQTEIGVKGLGTLNGWNMQWGVDVFRITRPQDTDVNGNYVIDGRSRHEGIEASWQGHHGAWTAWGGLMLLNAKRQSSSQANVNGQSPINVPDSTLKASGSYRFSIPVPLLVQLDLIHEGRRWVDAANTVRLPSWTRTDVSFRHAKNVDGQTLTWRLGVSNVFDVQAWREAALSGGHTYLFPQLPRTITASAQLDF